MRETKGLITPPIPHSVQIIALMFAFFACVVPVAAQTCGNGVSCKPADWSLPNLPELRSPTPIVYDGAGAAGTPTAAPTVTLQPSPVYTYTPVPTFTPFLDTAPINEAVSTLEAITGGTRAPVLNAEGTPIDRDSHIAQVTYISSLFFGYVRGLNNNIFGSFAPLVSVLVAGFSFLIFSKLFSLFAPVFMVLFGFIRKVITFILDFIPF